MTEDLFNQDGKTFSRSIHSPQLKSLAGRDIWLGTSSWNYRGWTNQVYFGPFAKRSADLLPQYAESFPAVCNDSAYYKLPEVSELQAMDERLPENFKMAFKVTELLTICKFGKHHRFGTPGSLNTSYLDAQTFSEHFIAPIVQTLGSKAGPLILEFSPFFFDKAWGEKQYRPIDLVSDLGEFFSRLSTTDSERVQLSVEVRDPVFLEMDEYFDCLAHFNVAHVINAQSHMPEITEQLANPRIHTASFDVVRALTRPDVLHESAVKEFEPYTHTQLELPFLREGLLRIIQRSQENRSALYMFINNRTEGNAPNTIAALLNQLALSLS